jgi:hypothetical protein
MGKQKKDSTTIKKVLDDKRSLFYVSFNGAHTEVCIGVVAKGERMTQDEFLTRLQKFIDTVRKKGLHFLDTETSSLH